MTLLITVLQYILLISVVLLLPESLTAQQNNTGKKLKVEKKAGKGMIIRLNTPAKADSLKTKDFRLTKEEAKKLEGQSIRFVLNPEGGYSVEIVHPDSAEAQYQHALDVINGKVEARSKRADLVDGYFRHLQKSDPMEDYKLPLRIYAMALSHNRLKITVENHTDKPLTNFRLHPNQLPSGWHTLPSEYKTQSIPAKGIDDFIFELNASEHGEAHHVGFQLSSNEIITSWSARVESASISERSIPEVFELHGNYPNPFNPTTTISYALPEAMNVKLEIFTINGQKAATLVNQRQSAGFYNVVWDARQSASGTYIYKITSVSENGTFYFDERKLTLIK